MCSQRLDNRVIPLQRIASHSVVRPKLQPLTGGTTFFHFVPHLRHTQDFLSATSACFAACWCCLRSAASCLADGFCLFASRPSALMYFATMMRWATNRYTSARSARFTCSACSRSFRYESKSCSHSRCIMPTCWTAFRSYEAMNAYACRHSPESSP